MKYIQEISSVDNAKGLIVSKEGSLKNTDSLQEPVSTGKRLDVVHDFAWYAGPRASSSRLDKIPRGLIVERKQILNSLLSGALYYLNTIKRTTDELSGGKLSELTSALGKLNSKAEGTFLENATKAVSGFIEDAKKAGSDDARLLENNNLKSLIGIYLTQKTGFNYILPYLNNPYDVGTSWNDEGTGPLAGLVNKGMAVVDEISRLVNITQPGVYIQKPKYYNFEQEGKSVSFNFPLFNTVNIGDELQYKNNYELLWLLTYQNKPFKTSFARTVPGKIYSVVIPGVVSMPYAYISNMSVDFKGTVRQLEVDVPTVYKAPIPEAYVVNITFTSLLNDFANTMVGSGFTASLDGNNLSATIKRS